MNFDNIKIPYKKRAWLIATVCHMLGLAIIVVCYYGFFSDHIKQQRVNVEKSQVITADLLSFDQSQAAVDKQNKAGGAQQSLLLQQSEHGQHKAVKDHDQHAKKSSDDDRSESDQNKVASKKQSNQKKQVSSQAEVKAYLKDVSQYLYHQISQKITVHHAVNGKLTATLAEDGRLSGIQIQLDQADPALEKQLLKILQKYQGKKALAKPITVVIPVAFD